MLDRKPIFLGGQGGVVGPCRIAYGTVTAAGTICRKDELREGRLIFGGPGKSANIPYSPGGKAVKRTVMNNLTYIANLIALMRWYDQVRSLFIADMFPEALLSGMKDTLALGINERVNRLNDFLEPLLESGEKRIEIERLFQSCLSEKGDERLMNDFISALSARIHGPKKDYLGTINDLSDDEKKTGTAWLQTVVNQVVGKTEQPVIELIKRN
jgi:UDP-N-acetylglucosamine/UDP-N-acetylgalactosamine diphosphorylase